MCDALPAAFLDPVVKSAYDMSLQLAAGGESYLHASPVQGFVNLGAMP